MSKLVFNPNEISQLKEIIDRVEKGNQVIVSELTDIIESVANDTTISRTVELNEEEFQVGVSLISFIGRILQLTLPEANYKIIVEQHLPKVTLRIMTSEEDKVAVESVLERYCYILRGKSPMNSLAEDGESVIVELKQKLDMSVIELAMAQDSLSESSIALPTDFEKMQDNMKLLHEKIGGGLSRVAQLERVIEILLEQEQGLIHDALHTLKTKLSYPLKESDVDDIKNALSKVEENEPDSFNQLQQTLNVASTSGQAGDRLVSWLVQINNIMPH